MKIIFKIDKQHYHKTLPGMLITALPGLWSLADLARQKQLIHNYPGDFMVHFFQYVYLGFFVTIFYPVSDALHLKADSWQESLLFYGSCISLWLLVSVVLALPFLLRRRGKFLLGLSLGILFSVPINLFAFAYSRSTLH